MSLWTFLHHRQPPAPSGPSQGLLDAQQHLRRVRAKEPRVARLVEKAAAQVDANHFGEGIANALGAPPK